MSVPADAEFGRHVIRKVAWRLIPLLVVLYFFAYLDRVNVGFAALTMNADLGLSATAYGIGAGTMRKSVDVISAMEKAVAGLG